MKSRGAYDSIPNCIHECQLDSEVEFNERWGVPSCPPWELWPLSRASRILVCHFGSNVVVSRIDLAVDRIKTNTAGGVRAHAVVVVRKWHAVETMNYFQCPDWGPVSGWTVASIRLMQPCRGSNFPCRVMLDRGGKGVCFSHKIKSTSWSAAFALPNIWPLPNVKLWPIRLVCQQLRYFSLAGAHGFVFVFLDKPLFCRMWCTVQ